MSHQQENQQSPRLSSAFSVFSKSPISPRVPPDSPRPTSKRSGSIGRHASLGSYQQEDSYFTDLLSYSLDRLGKEPEILAAEREQLKGLSQESAIRHYRGFIEVSTCLRKLKTEVAAISEHLDALQEDLPKLTDSCDSFTASAKDHVASRTQNKQLLKHHGVLLEVLEVPSLMEACLRNGSYDNALDLRAFVSKTALVHPDLRVVQNLAKETEVMSQEMLAGLLDRLRSNIQLPECLRVVAHLRRLAPFLETELRQTFLQCREEWLADLVSSLDDTNAYDYLKRLTDVHRLQLFDVVMQFRAIFSDDASLHEDGTASDNSAVYSWAEYRVVFYLETLAKQLPRIREGGGIASVLEHCMYCGMSLGRVGLDFRGLLPSIFEACILNLFTTSIQAAVEASLMVLDLHKWISLPTPLTRRTKHHQLPESSSSLGPSPALEPPPYKLMEHPPLAILANALLSALNELRHCAPLSLQSRLAAVIQDGLHAVVHAMAHYKATRALSEEEAPLLEAACVALSDTLCPYIVACFSRIYPGSGGLVDLKKVTAAIRETQKEEAVANEDSGPVVVRDSRGENSQHNAL